ncbi:hypothetical protein L345_09603, partial [Ophiophagus hannah]
MIPCKTRAPVNSKYRQGQFDRDGFSEKLKEWLCSPLQNTPFMRAKILPCSPSRRLSMINGIHQYKVMKQLGHQRHAALPTALAIPATPDMVSNHGKLNLALKFIPAGSEEPGFPPTGELHMWVKNAENLVPRYILPDDTKLSRQKTRIVKKNLNPTFNHTMVYDGFEVP